MNGSEILRLPMSAHVSTKKLEKLENNRRFKIGQGWLFSDETVVKSFERYPIAYN